MASVLGNPAPGADALEELVSELAGLIATRILKEPGRAIAPDEAMISSGLVDSFSLVDLALITEDRYGARLDDTELNAEHVDTLRQLARLVLSRRTK